MAKPPNTAFTQLLLLSKWKEYNKRDINWTNAPTEKAMKADKRIPEIISNAFSELIYFPILAKLSPSLFEILINAIATAAPNNSNTMETVVEVGIPKELKISNSRISVIITAIKMNIISLK